MRNFPMHLWRGLMSHKDHSAILSNHLKSKDNPKGELSFSAWGKGLQRLAIGLMERGLEPGQRVGFAARNAMEWISLAVATWLAGGCVVPIRHDLGRRHTLRALARSGCDWIVLSDLAALDELRGQGSQLPDHLRWLLLNEPSNPSTESTIGFDALMELGRFREIRGGDKTLAKRMYEIPLSQPSLILFDPVDTEDPHGAFFSGERVARHLDELGEDFRWQEHEKLAVALNLGWPHAILTAVASSMRGHTLVLDRSDEALMDALKDHDPSLLLVPSSLLEAQGRTWRAELERAPEFLKRLDGEDAAPQQNAPKRFTLLGALGALSQNAATRALHDPLRQRVGRDLRQIFKVGPSLSEGLAELFMKLELEVLSIHGYPETGITHMERPGATKRGSMGRPVLGVSARIAGAKHEDDTGELLIRTENVSMGYWDEKGPRTLKEGWLHTGDTAHMHSGFLFLEGDASAHVTHEEE